MPCIGNSFNGIRIFNLSLKVPVAVQQSPPRILPSSSCLRAALSKLGKKKLQILIRLFTGNAADNPKIPLPQMELLPSITPPYMSSFYRKDKHHKTHTVTCTDSNLTNVLAILNSSTPFTFASIPFSSSALKPPWWNSVNQITTFEEEGKPGNRLSFSCRSIRSFVGYASLHVSSWDRPDATCHSRKRKAGIGMDAVIALPSSPCPHRRAPRQCRKRMGYFSCRCCPWH